MKGVSIVETETLQALIDEVRELKNTIIPRRNIYLNTTEAASMIGFSEVWLCNNKQHIGYSTINKSIRFKIKDLEDYMSQNYFKTKHPKR